MRSAIAAFVIVTAAVGLLLGGVGAISPMTRWLAALAVGVIAAWLVGGPRAGAGATGPIPTTSMTDRPNTGARSAPEPASTPTTEQRRDVPSPARCPECGGRGFVDRI